MMRSGRFAKVLVLMLSGALLTGCVVLPFGGGHHGRYERGDRHADGRYDGHRDAAPRGR